MFKFINKIVDKIKARAKRDKSEKLIESEKKFNAALVQAYSKITAVKDNISYHQRLMKIGYTFAGAKRYGKLKHIYRHTKSQRIRKKVYMKLKDIE